MNNNPRNKHPHRLDGPNCTVTGQSVSPTPGGYGNLGGDADDSGDDLLEETSEGQPSDGSSRQPSDDSGDDGDDY